MVIGQIPITGDNYNQLMYKVMMGEYVRPHECRPDVPVELDAVIVAAMSLNPEARPRSAAELEQALLPFCRPTFREYTIERTSAPGFAPVMAPQPLSRSGVPPMGSGTDRTVLAPTPMHPPRSKKGLLIAVLAVAVIGGGIAAIAIGASGGGSSEPVAAAPPVEKPAPAPTPPPVVAPTPAPAAKVTLRFAITPADAEVDVDGKRAAADQIVVDKDDQRHHVHIAAAGFEAHDEDIKFDESQRLTIELVKEKKAGATPTKTPPHTRDKKPDKIESKSPYDE
jgi:hypothetical protein